MAIAAARTQTPQAERARIRCFFLPRFCFRFRVLLLDVGYVGVGVGVGVSALCC